MVKSIPSSSPAPPPEAVRPRLPSAGEVKVREGVAVDSVRRAEYKLSPTVVSFCPLIYGLYQLPKRERVRMQVSDLAHFFVYS